MSYIITKSLFGFPETVEKVSKEATTRYYVTAVYGFSSSLRRKGLSEQYIDKTDVLVHPDKASPTLFYRLLKELEPYRTRYLEMLERFSAEEREVRQRHASERDSFYSRYSARIDALLQEASCDS